MHLRRFWPVLGCTLAAILIRPFGISAADDSLAAALARMDKAASGFKGLSAKLKKVHYTAVIKEEDVSSGTILVKRPKPRDLRAKVDIEQPDSKIAFIEGHKVQVYLPQSQEVQTYDLGKESSVVDQFLLLGFGSNSRELAGAYTIKLGEQDTIAGEKTTWIELIPKDKDVLAHLKKVDLWISDTSGLTVQQKFYQPGGDYDVLTYTGIQSNPNIPDSAFNLPKGAHRATSRKN